MTTLIPLEIVAITCPTCREVGFDCLCILEYHKHCVTRPCIDCHAKLMRDAEIKAGWIFER